MDINKQDLEKIASVFGEMDGKSEDEMINELALMVKRGEGGLTPNKAKRMIRTVMPIVDRGQRRKLEKLLKALG